MQVPVLSGSTQLSGAALAGMGMSVDVIWLVFCAGLVFVMQPGFACLESGLARSKNSINVATKNVADFIICTFFYLVIGFGLMFGDSYYGLFGGSLLFFNAHSAELVAFFMFQLMFCGTAATIISGAVAERMPFKAYLLVSALVSLIIYPIFGHWAWAGVIAEGQGWLAEIGFVDFAGGTVVHSVAGWVSLAAVIIIGPRIGRMGPNRVAFRSHSLPMATLGMFLIWFGWIGFNGGSLLTADERVPLIILNTMVAGSMGGLGAIVVGYWRGGRVEVADLINGCLAGLVAITPTAHCVGLASAALLSFIGGILCLFACEAIRKMGIDDAVNAFPVHGVSGVWGTLCVAIFGDLELIGTGLGRLEQFGVQCVGVTAATVWAFGLGYVLLRLADRVVHLRVPEAWERIGLNVSEHGESTDQLDLLRRMDRHRRTGDFTRPIEVEADSEVGDIARQYNLVLERLSAAKAEAEQANATKSRFLASMSHELRTPLNAIIGFSEMMTKKYFGDLGSAKYDDYAGEIYRSSTHLLDLVNEILNISTIESGGYNLSKSLVDLKAIARESARVASQSVREKSLKLVVIGDNDAPPLEADPRAMRQIVLNLVSNAIRHTPSGGSITVEVSIVGDLHILYVRDTGEGIAPDWLPRLTDAFATSATNPYLAEGGVGLGLSIVKMLVELHGGTLSIDSKLGEGTEVKVSIPNPWTGTMP